MNIVGKIQFERRGDGGLAERQGWNPGELSAEERQTVAAVLRETADGMERGEFFVDGVLTPFPTAKAGVRK